jgi:hypothetical protein
VSSPRFKPRNYAQQPDLFGKHTVMTWLPVSDDASEDTLDQIGASQRQHIAAMAIREAAIAQFGSVKVYAQMHDLNYPRLNSLLNGTALMRFEDVANAERNLGIELPL